MQFLNYNEINLYDYQLLMPTFNDSKNIFESELNKKCMIKSDHMKLLDIKDNTIRCEFLYNTNKFYQFMLKSDNYYKGCIINNAVGWFGNSLNGDTINNMFKGVIALPNKLPNFPTVELVLDSGCEILNRSNKSIRLDQLKLNMEVVLFISLECLEFYKSRCNLRYKVHKVQSMGSVCQVLENLFNHGDNESEIDDRDNIDDEINDITASTFR